MKRVLAIVVTALLVAVTVPAAAGAAIEAPLVRINDVKYASAGCSSQDLYSSVSGYKQQDSRAKTDLQPLKVGARANMPKWCSKRVTKICLTTSLTMSGSKTLTSSASFGVPNQYFGGRATTLAGNVATFNGTAKCKSIAPLATPAYSIASENGFVFFNAGGTTVLKTAVVGLKSVFTFSDGSTKTISQRFVVKG
jgi:hypothetical protein